MNVSPLEEEKAHRNLAVASRYNDITGKVTGYCGTSNKNYIYNLYFHGEITGFTKDYSFIFYIASPQFAYMKCTVPASTDVNSYVVCGIDVDKFYTSGNTYNLKDEFLPFQIAKYLIGKLLLKVII